MNNEMLILINHIATPIIEEEIGNEHWYLASPFSSENAEVTKKWIDEITILTRRVMEKFKTVSIFTPVIYTSKLAQGYKPTIGWYEIGLRHLNKCDRLVIMQLEGWEKSSGIALEVGYARAMGMEISTLKPDEFPGSVRERI